MAQTYSRLAIDCNRPTHVAQSIPEISELTEIPGNHMLSPEQREARVEALSGGSTISTTSGTSGAAAAAGVAR